MQLNYQSLGVSMGKKSKYRSHKGFSNAPDKNMLKLLNREFFKLTTEQKWETIKKFIATDPIWKVRALKAFEKNNILVVGYFNQDQYLSDRGKYQTKSGFYLCDRQADDPLFEEHSRYIQQYENDALVVSLIENNQICFDLVHLRPTANCNETIRI